MKLDLWMWKVVWFPLTRSAVVKPVAAILRNGCFRDNGTATRSVHTISTCADAEWAGGCICSFDEFILVPSIRLFSCSVVENSIL